jgi:arylsulfatase A-like enzyme
MAVDDMIGQIFEAMGSLEERNNTIAIFISDNGFVYGDHNVFRKRVPYTNSIHVPLFLWAPGLVQAGSVDRNLVLNLDIGTTIFDLAGIDPAHELDGTSLLDPRVRDHVLGEAIYDQQEEPRVPGWSSYRSRDIQYIEYYAEDGSVNFREYYDLQKDPYQLRNLLGDDNPDNDPDVTQLHDTLEADRTCAGASCP